MIALIRQNLFFFIPYFLLLIVGTLLLFTHEKGDMVLLVNQNHNAWLDPLFKYGTELGNGILFITIIFFMAAFRLRNALVGLLTFGFMGVLIITLKGLVFSEMVRPKLFFEGLEGLNFVEGVRVMSHHTFPSGHSATGFSLFCMLALIIPNKKLGLLFIVCAAIVGISRVYLFQHFLIDVYVGSILGVLISMLVYHYVLASRWVQHNSVLNRSLISYILPRNG